MKKLKAEDIHVGTLGYAWMEVIAQPQAETEPYWHTATAMVPVSVVSVDSSCAQVTSVAFRAPQTCNADRFRSISLKRADGLCDLWIPEEGDLR